MSEFDPKLYDNLINEFVSVNQLLHNTAETPLSKGKTNVDIAKMLTALTGLEHNPPETEAEAIGNKKGLEGVINARYGTPIINSFSDSQINLAKQNTKFAIDFLIPQLTAYAKKNDLTVSGGGEIAESYKLVDKIMNNALSDSELETIAGEMADEMVEKVKASEQDMLKERTDWDEVRKAFKNIYSNSPRAPNKKMKYLDRHLRKIENLANTEPDALEKYIKNISDKIADSSIELPQKVGDIVNLTAIQKHYVTNAKPEQYLLLTAKLYGLNLID